MAEHAVLISLMVHRNPASRYMCTENSYACLGGDQGELALALISSKKSYSAVLRLSKLLRYRLDAGLSEDFQCHLLSKGKAIEDTLAKLRSEDLHKQCIGEVEKIILRNRGKFDGFDVNAVCSSSIEIAKRVDELRIAIKNDTQCEAEDF